MAARGAGPDGVGEPVRPGLRDARSGRAEVAGGGVRDPRFEGKQDVPRPDAVQACAAQFPLPGGAAQSRSRAFAALRLTSVSSSFFSRR